MEIEKIGINIRQHKDLIRCLYEIVEASGYRQFIPSSQLIDLIANEPTFTKKRLYLSGVVPGNCS
jgi:hypothetical protein